MFMYSKNNTVLYLFTVKSEACFYSVYLLILWMQYAQ